MNSVIAPPSDPAVSGLLSLTALMADPAATKKAIADYTAAKTAAETAIKELAVKEAAQTAENERLIKHAEHLDSREATIKAYEADITERLHQVDAREKAHIAAVNAHDSAVKQANTDASVRDSALGRREAAIEAREKAADEKHAAAVAKEIEHHTALEAMRALVGR